jgi:hypothetical protein
MLVAVEINSPAFGMELEIVSSGMPLQVKLTGEIKAGDASRIHDALEKAKPTKLAATLAKIAPTSSYDSRQWLWVDVESGGGDFDESLALGRYLRASNALVTTTKLCASACVFLLAGAVERANLAATPGAIQIHRPCLQDARGWTQDTLDRFHRDVHQKIVTYLDDMHVPTLLAEMMFAVPPEDVHALTKSEILVFLPERDPTWDELTVARRAAFHGLGTEDYRTLGRTVKADRIGASIDDVAAASMLLSGRCPSFPGFIRRGGNSNFINCSKNSVGVTIERNLTGRVLLVAKN